MVSEIYKGCMTIGHRFKEKYGEVGAIWDWNGSEECSTVAKNAYELATTLFISFEDALDYVMDIVLSSGFRTVDDHAWDDYCRGFLAGEIIGLPTEENLKIAEKADDLWWINDWGYYSDAINEAILRSEVRKDN